MPDRVAAYIINEAKGPEQNPEIRTVTPNIVKFRVPILQEGGIQNRNGRVYDWEVLQEGVAHSFLQERLRTGTLYCECGHPREQSIDRQIHIDRDNVTCIIKEIEMRKPVVVGSLVETASTRKGRDLRGLIVDNGCKVAFSMRGLGRVVEQGGSIHVQRPLRIVTWDDVVHPSVPDAYMGEVIAQEEEKKVVGESMTVLHENIFAKFILESSPDARRTLDALGVDPAADGSNLSINGEGLLVVDDGEGIKLACVTEAQLRGAVDEYLVGLGKGLRRRAMTPE